MNQHEDDYKQARLLRKYNYFRMAIQCYRTPVGIMIAFVGFAVMFSQPAIVLAQVHGEETAALLNPPASGFNLQDSDAKAVAIADRVMKAMGGRKAWDETRYVSWNFFGRRHHLWDKKTGDIRIEAADDEGHITIWLMNINTKKGRVRVDDNDETIDPKMMEQGYGAWVNDAYWLFMPYKLKDSGVTLKYVGEGKTEEGHDAEMIEMTFAGVGLTPENKYHIWVGKQSNLVEQWAFYSKATDEEPKFIIPWANWQQYGKIMLSGDRGRAKITDIAVLKTVPDDAFSSFNKIDWDFNKVKAGTDGG